MFFTSIIAIGGWGGIAYGSISGVISIIAFIGMVIALLVSKIAKNITR